MDRVSAEAGATGVAFRDEAEHLVAAAARASEAAATLSTDLQRESGLLGTAAELAAARTAEVHQTVQSQHAELRNATDLVIDPPPKRAAGRSARPACATGGAA